MFASNEYSISYTGLKQGKHHYQFELGTTFFEAFEYGLIQEASVQMSVELEKMSSMMTLNFEFSGWVNCDCDICLDPMKIDVLGNNRLIVKFGDETYEETEEIIILSHAEHKIELAQYMYEFVHLAMPSKRSHNPEDCNQDMINRLSDDSSDEGETPIDPRWKALEGLKK